MLIAVQALLAFAAAVSGPLDTSCYYEKDKGQSYRGLTSHTVSGRQCQGWSEQRPHKINMAAADADLDGLGPHNYCRNPMGDKSGPYCYTMDSNKETELCNVPKCQPDHEVANLKAKRDELKAAMGWHNCDCSEAGSTQSGKGGAGPAISFLHRGVGNATGAKCSCQKQRAAK
mmetsp:Transcript_14031/g.34045  ORF Transcript_14031/g.34045 Transcript_14031/m.34045 type:complete len:173 (+) Transcript_14031:116-634(+)